MSYSDTFDNEFVGYFGGISVYHPLEIVPALIGEDPENFACGPEHLLIGGGSGEHPGIVVSAPGEAVVCFVRAWWEDAKPAAARGASRIARLCKAARKGGGSKTGSHPRRE